VEAPGGWHVRESLSLNDHWHSLEFAIACLLLNTNEGCTTDDAVIGRPGRAARDDLLDGPPGCAGPVSQ
jgi:hypothetical protein